MTAPPLAMRSQPGLSETLTGPKDPRRCQSCGNEHSTATPLARWLEHDPWDRVPDRPVVVVLCQRCSARLIDPHPRLYRQLATNEPFPGCMSLCLGCALRDGVHCTSPTARVNGGPGVELEFTKPPMRFHVYCGRGKGGSGSGWVTEYGRVIGCNARRGVPA